MLQARIIFVNKGETQRKKTPATWRHVAGRGWIAGIASRGEAAHRNTCFGMALGPGGGQGRGEEEDSLRHALEATASSQTLTQTLATRQIADHVFGQQVNRLGIFRPFQPLLVDGQMLQGIAQTQEIGITLTHGHIHLG